MLRILGSPRKLCDGLTRRDFLQVGGLGLLGLGASNLTASPATQRAFDRSFGKAKSCILLFLYGSPSQLETFDTKPDSPVEIRGELKTIRSNVVGMDVGELLPNLSRVMDKVTVIRSMTHPHPIHGVAIDRLAGDAAHPRAQFRQGEVLHPPLPLRFPQPARDV